MQELHAFAFGDGLEQELRLRAVAERAVGDLARLAPCELDKLLQRIGRHRRVHDNELSALRDHRDRREALVRVVGQLLEQEPVTHHRGVDRHEERVAVRRRVRGALCAYERTRARDILDHHRLAPQRREFRREAACEQVDGARGRVGNDDLHQPVRVRLRVGTERGEEQRAEREGARGDHEAASSRPRSRPSTAITGASVTRKSTASLPAT